MGVQADIYLSGRSGHTSSRIAINILAITFSTTFALASVVTFVSMYATACAGVSVFNSVANAASVIAFNFLVC